MSDRHLKGIKGWLILPALGIISSIPMLLYTIVESYFDLFPSGILEAFSSPDSPNYMSGFLAAIIFEEVGNTTFVIGYGYLAYLFFTKNYKAPKWYIRILIGYFIFITADLIIVASLFGIELIDNETEKEVVRALFACLIWVPYFLISKRVKNTFVEGKPVAPSQDFENSLPKVIS